MLHNYLKIALRSLRQSPLYGLLNVAGLTLGLTCGLLMAAYVLDDLSYDRFHQNADRIVLLQQFENSAVTGGKLATDFNQKFAQVEQAVRLKQAKPLITRQGMTAYEENFFFADSNAFSVFTLPLALGNPQTALAEQYGIVLSETMARKYFANQNPLGQTLRYDNKHTLHVTGVMRDLPGNSHQKIDFLANYANANELVGWDVTTNLWAGSAWTYLLLAPGTPLTTIESQFPTYLKQLNDPNVGVWKLHLIPLTDIYLKTDLIAANRLTYVAIFSIVALLILALAAFNYVNLATARATKRAKEVGVRKVLGSSFSQLWGQFMGETVLYVGLSVLLTALVVPAALPAFNQLADKRLTLGTLFSPEQAGWFFVGLLALCLLAGGYPALVLSSFRPAAVLKGVFRPVQSRAGRQPLLRQALVVGQFAVSVVMIVATLVVYKQLYYVQHKNLGYNREQILVMNLPGATELSKQRFKQQLKALAGIDAVSQSYSVPGSGALRGEKLVSEYAPKGATNLSINRLTIDENFLQTFGIRLLQGRNFDANRPADQKAFLINQAAMNYFGWKNLTGKTVGYYTYEYDQTGNYREVPQRGPVIGLVADYHQTNLKNVIKPLLFSFNQGGESQLSARILPPAKTLGGEKPGDGILGGLTPTVQQIESLWKSNFPDTPFDYEFMDDFFDRTYQSDLRTGQVFGLFAALAVLISCLGLFGLAAFTAEQRTKEIGVRKVLGASVGSVVTLLSRDFLRLVLIAVVIASPLAWWSMNQWLQGFAYKIDIEWWVFALAGLVAVGIALLTVSFQSVKTALMNPVKSLRAE